MGFTGGADDVPHLQAAKAALASLAAEKGAEDPEVVAMTARCGETRTKVDSICTAFNMEKLQDEKAPENVCKGSDRKELEKRIRAEWTQLYPEDQILGMRFHMADWQRNGAPAVHLPRARSRYRSSLSASPSTRST